MYVCVSTHVCACACAFVCMRVWWFCHLSAPAVGTSFYLWIQFRKYYDIGFWYSFWGLVISRWLGSILLFVHHLYWCYCFSLLYSLSGSHLTLGFIYLFYFFFLLRLNNYIRYSNCVAPLLRNIGGNIDCQMQHCLNHSSHTNVA